MRRREKPRRSLGVRSTTPPRPYTLDSFPPDCCHVITVFVWISSAANSKHSSLPSLPSVVSALRGEFGIRLIMSGASSSARGVSQDDHSSSRSASARPTDAIQPPAKRRKVPLACTSCRDRKTRCDGQRPCCSTCKKRGIGSNCLYEEGFLRTQRHVSVG